MLFIFSTPVLIRHLGQLKTVVFLHWYVIHIVLLPTALTVADLALDTLCSATQKAYFYLCYVTQGSKASKPLYPHIL